jgi:GNAT superfamily N-acetyltransferase
MSHSPGTGRRRLLMSAETDRLARLPAVEGPCRRLRREHAEPLGHLFAAAFAGTVEDDGRLLVNPAADMRDALRGAFGQLVQPASLAIADERGMRAAVITVLMDDGSPLIAFCMTAPEWQRHGYATGLIGAASAALAQAGHERVLLAVHRASPARALYERLGFEPS